jgi:glutamate synthase domain-containing protein 3
VLASLGLRSITELVGRLDLLQPRDSVPAGRLDTAALLSPLAHGAKLDAEQFPEHGPAGARTLNGRVAARARLAIGRYALEIGEEVRNTDRSVGATLAGLIAGEFGDAGVSGMPIRLNLTGHAGQSLGAFSVPGMEIHLVGDANDGVGKGMHGGLVTIRPPADTPLDEQVLAGNAVLYGATGGALFVAGRAGERFAVRNGGASAVVEGVGHHGCEYMTGGVVAVLGPTGLNFGAGMTGGIAYVYDPEAQLEKSINPELVDAGPLTTEDDARLLTLIMAHRDATGSRVAACLLADWPAHVPAFSVVRPKGSPARVQTSRAPLAGPTRVLAHRGAVAAEAGAAGHG